MFGTLGGPEILLILVLALIVFGPRKLPEIGRSMGRMMAEFRKASNEFRRTLEDEVEAEKTHPAPLPSPDAPGDTTASPPAVTAPPEPPASAGAREAEPEPVPRTE